MAFRTGASAQPVSWDRHSTWTWRKPENCAFARAFRSIPITLTEAISAASCFPLVFVSGEQGTTLHTLLRLGAQGHSPFIGQHGQWQAAWLPPRLTAWPFDLVEADGGHALALHETPDLVVEGPGGTPIFAAGDTATLSPATARMAAILKAQAEALPATIRAAMALRDQGLLTPLDGDASILTVDPAAAASLTEDTVLALHSARALVLLHAGLVSLSHLPWMAKAEKHLAATSCAKPPPLPARERAGAGSSFLTALAADASADKTPLPFPGHSPS